MATKQSNLFMSLIL